MLYNIEENMLRILKHRTFAMILHSFVGGIAALLAAQQHSVLWGLGSLFFLMGAYTMRMAVIDPQRFSRR